MRKTFVLLALLLIAALPLTAETAPPLSGEIPGVEIQSDQILSHESLSAEIAPETVNLESDVQIDEFLATLEPQPEQKSLPYCGAIHGTPCSGSYIRCQWTPYEPEICICDDGTFSCY